ncbi:uncharacterized protein LOC141849872 [Brevipalpus obovatus]|uniref:uncharacterized protein LOC141849872 n=1 Tax=Brevipalpus obovatus TaxID=246614 RepID=UPI003D9EB801
MNKFIVLALSVVVCVSFIRCDQNEEYESPQELTALLNRANQAVAEIKNLFATKGNEFYHKKYLQAQEPIIRATILDELNKAQTVDEAKITKKKARDYSLRLQRAEKIIQDAKANKIPKRKSHSKKE